MPENNKENNKENGHWEYVDEITFDTSISQAAPPSKYRWFGRGPPDYSKLDFGDAVVSRSIDPNVVYVSSNIQPDSSCFVATAVYGTQSCEELDILREFRDEKLRPSPIGNVLVDVYYKVSPSFADFIRYKLPLKNVVKKILVEPGIKLSKKILR